MNKKPLQYEFPISRCEMINVTEMSELSMTYLYTHLNRDVDTRENVLDSAGNNLLRKDSAVHRPVPEER